MSHPGQGPDLRPKANWIHKFGNQFRQVFMKKGNKHKAFQGKQEMARRVRQMANGMDCGQHN